MRDRTLSIAIRRASGLLLAGAFLAAPVYADDSPATDATAIDCQQYTGAERTECERRSRMSEYRSETERAVAADPESVAGADDPALSTDADAVQGSERTRVSRADTDLDNEPQERDRSDAHDPDAHEPGEAHGADMRAAPRPNMERADERLSDPYRTDPGDDDSGMETEDSPQQ